MKVDLAALGEVATITAGQSPPGHTYNDNGSGLPFFQGKADFGDLHPVARKWCVAPRKIAEAGDILISVRAPVGPTNIATERCCIGRGLAAIRPDETVALRDFVHWNIKHRSPELVSKGQGSTFAAIGQNDLKSLLIPLPGLDEQRRIVAILNRAAKIERLRSQAQERLRELIPTLFIKMFGDPAENSMGWEVRALSEICMINPPARKLEHPGDMAVSFVPMSAVDGRSGTITSSEKRQLVEVSKGYTSFEEGDILFAKITPCMENGKAALARNLVNEIGRGSTEFYVLRAGESIVEDYLFQYIRRQEFRNEAKRSFTGTAGQQRVPKSFLQNVSVPVPPLDEQRRFVNLVETIRTATVLSKSNMEDTKSLLGSLMGRLLGNA